MNLTKKSIDEYRKFLICDEKSEATVEKYIHDVNYFYNYLDNRIVTKEILIAYKKMLLETYKVSSANSMLVALNMFFKVNNYPELKVKLMRLQKNCHKKSERELSKKEYDSLLRASKLTSNRKLDLLLQTLCCTGIRVSEHRFITYESINSGIATINNKGKIREIYIPKKLSKSLKEFCKLNSIKSGPVFITKNGNCLDRSNIWKMMKSLCEIAQVDQKKVFPHNLRHLFAVTYYRLEKDIVKLADILGHTSIETTRIYTFDGKTMDEVIYKRMNLFFG